MDTIIRLFKKYKEFIVYIFFGGLTTLVNIISFTLLSDIIGIHYLVSNAIAWIISVLFAFFTNRRWVFNSTKTSFTEISKEFSLFVGCRLLSGAADMLIMFICVDLLNINKFIAKLLTNVVVVILNYIFSKFIIFSGGKAK